MAYTPPPRGYSLSAPYDHTYHHQPQYAHTWDAASPPPAPRPHALRRVNHGYSPETGSYTYDAGRVSKNDSYRIFRLTSSDDDDDSEYNSSRERSKKERRRHREREDSPRIEDDKERKKSSSSRSAAADGGKKTSKKTSQHLLSPPQTPEISRLSTPELNTVSAGIRFCSCGCSDKEHEHQAKYDQGRAKMDSNIQAAMQHMAATQQKLRSRLSRED